MSQPVRREPQNREVFPNVTALLAAAIFLAAAPPLQALEPLAVNEVAPGVFVHQGRYEIFTPRNSGDTSNAGFIIGRNGVAVIDTGGSPRVGTELLAAIRARTALPVKYVINTHMHPDHVFGNVAFEGEKPVFVGHAKLPRALAARADRYLARNKELLGEAFEGTRIIAPTELVKDKLELDLGDRKLLIEAHPTAHTDNDVTVLDEKTGTMFLGDLLFATHVPALDGSIRGWLALIAKLDARTDVKLAVPGHGPSSMPWPSALAAEQRYLSKVADEVRGMIKQGKTLAEAAKTAGLSEKDAWLLFNDYHARNVSAAFAELEWEYLQTALHSRSKQKMQTTLSSRRLSLALAAVLALGLGAPAIAADDPWQDIRRDVFDNRDVVEGDGAVTLEAPYRAEDAAVVPLTMHIPASAGEVKSLTLVIDKNPAPVAATFTFGEAAGKGDRMLSTRVRIDMYSNVHAVIETADGKLHMATKFVKASGGCSAAASKDVDEALANLGKMQVRTFDDPEMKNRTPPTREAQVMIRHPNYTGMQMDQLTREYTPAKFVQEMEVKRGGQLIFKMEGGISISENPHFRFTFAPGDDDIVEVTAKDTDGKVFSANSAGKAS